MLQDGNLRIRHLLLRDDPRHAHVKVALFNTDPQGHYVQGDILALTNTYPWTSARKKTPTLSTRRNSIVEVSP